MDFNFRTVPLWGRKTKVSLITESDRTVALPFYSLTGALPGFFKGGGEGAQSQSVGTHQIIMSFLQPLVGCLV